MACCCGNPTGACCDSAFLDSSCQPRCTEVAELNCSGPTKTFKGAGTNCQTPCFPIGRCCGPDHINIKGGDTGAVCRDLTEAECTARGGRFLSGCLTCDSMLDEGGVKHCGRVCYCEDGVTPRPSSVTVIYNNRSQAGRLPTDPRYGYNWNGAYTLPNTSLDCSFFWKSYLVPVPLQLQSQLGPYALMFATWDMALNTPYQAFRSYIYKIGSGEILLAGGGTDRTGSNFPLSEQRAALCRGDVVTHGANPDNGMPVFSIFSNGFGPLP